MKRIALVSDTHDLLRDGHSHRPSEETRQGVRFVNPGSVGPRRFDLPISWAFWHEDGTIEFISLPF